MAAVLALTYWGTELGMNVFHAGNAVSIIATIGAFLIVACLGFYLRSLRPYTEFHTRLNQRRAKTWNWLVGVLVSGVLASLAATVIARQIWK
jgi:hypothetical protein